MANSPFSTRVTDVIARLFSSSSSSWSQNTLSSSSSSCRCMLARCLTRSSGHVLSTGWAGTVTWSGPPYESTALERESALHPEWSCSWAPCVTSQLTWRCLLVVSQFA